MLLAVMVRPPLVVMVVTPAVSVAALMLSLPCLMTNSSWIASDLTLGSMAVIFKVGLG